MLSGLRFVPREEVIGGSEEEGKNVKQRSSKERSSKERSSKEHHSAATRKDAGLEWMMKAPTSSSSGILKKENNSPVLESQEEPPSSKPNPKELNPYLKDGGEGYPSETEEKSSIINNSGKCQLHNSMIGDGGASWRLKALKRAKERADEEGRRLDEVVEERWGSLAKMTVSVSGTRAAPAKSHLHAIRQRKFNQDGPKEQLEKSDDANKSTSPSTTIDKDDRIMRRSDRDYLKDISHGHPRMKAPQVDNALSWRKRKPSNVISHRADDAAIIDTASAALNKFENDGNFLERLKRNQKDLSTRVPKNEMPESNVDMGSVSPEVEKHNKGSEHAIEVIPGLSANQLAAKALQLRLKGRVKESEELLHQSEVMLKMEKTSRSEGASDARAVHSGERRVTGAIAKTVVAERKHRTQKNEGDAAMASSIMGNKLYSMATSADDEYMYDAEFEIDDKRKSDNKKKKHKGEKGDMQMIRDHKHIVTQQERCKFCIESSNRPKHLIISIANATYLMLPPNELLVKGHCFIVPTQHEGSSRNVDENVWEELRNFKKCLLKMFANQDMDVLFMETSMNLAQQRHHCLIECIPVPRHLAKQAPLYFKKAIEEAEDEWSQHNAKKLIDTSTKGLRGCIPKNFPYFHVEFGLNAGYVHVIDDEKNFKAHFGRDVVRGVLQLPEEGMYGKGRQQSFEQQKKATMEFQKMWDPFDWTKMLD